MRKYLNPRHIICQGLIFAFLLNSLGPLPDAQAQDLALPVAGTMVPLSPAFNPPILKGIKVHPDNPFRFDFILDRGDSQLSNDALKDESGKLIKYFLASLTIPEKDLWVNLSPYEKDRIVPESFGRTEMGRDLLAEDYMLKQITASLIYPEGETGKKFWKRIYEEAAKRFGTTNVPVNTFNKVWIVPQKAVVYENAKAGTAYVVESRLKVMLEQDYLALEKNTVKKIAVSPWAPRNDTVNALGSQIVRQIVIPELTREVNFDRNFAQLRQVYNSLILATWYKKKIKDSILEQVYADKKKVAGVNIDDPKETERIYQRYLQAFKKGAYNYIKEEIDPLSQQTVPRKYFSGGLGFIPANMDRAMVIASFDKNFVPESNALDLVVNLDAAMTETPDSKTIWQEGMNKMQILLDALDSFYKNISVTGDTSGVGHALISPLFRAYTDYQYAHDKDSQEILMTKEKGNQIKIDLKLFGLFLSVFSDEEKLKRDLPKYQQQLSRLISDEQMDSETRLLIANVSSIVTFLNDEKNMEEFSSNLKPVKQVYDEHIGRINEIIDQLIKSGHAAMFPRRLFMAESVVAAATWEKERAVLLNMQKAFDAGTNNTRGFRSYGYRIKDPDKIRILNDTTGDHVIPVWNRNDASPTYYYNEGFNRSEAPEFIIFEQMIKDLRLLGFQNIAAKVEIQYPHVWGGNDNVVISGLGVGYGINYTPEDVAHLKQAIEDWIMRKLAAVKAPAAGELGANAAMNTQVKKIWDLTPNIVMVHLMTVRPRALNGLDRLVRRFKNPLAIVSGAYPLIPAFNYVPSIQSRSGEFTPVFSKGSKDAVFVGEQFVDCLAKAVADFGKAIFQSGEKEARVYLIAPYVWVNDSGKSIQADTLEDFLEDMDHGKPSDRIHEFVPLNKDDYLKRLFQWIESPPPYIESYYLHKEYLSSTVVKVLVNGSEEIVYGKEGAAHELVIEIVRANDPRISDAAMGGNPVDENVTASKAVETFGEAIRQARLRARLEMKEAAEKWDISESQLSRVESGARVPGRESAIKIWSKRTGLSEDYLLGLAKESYLSKEPKTFGEIIYLARRAMELTQDQAAQRLGMKDTKKLELIESGKYTPQNPIIIRKFAEVFDLDPEYLGTFADKALIAKSTDLGGIDMSAVKVDSRGQGIRFHIDQAHLAGLENAPGFVPVIISIKPMTDILGFLGLNAAQNFKNTTAT